MSKAGMGLGIVGIVLVGAALAGPWWTFSMSGNVLLLSFNMTLGFGVFGGSASGTLPGGGGLLTSGNYADMPATGGVFQLGMLLAVLGMVLGVVTLAASAMGGARPGLRRVGALMGVVGFVFVLLAAMYVMANLPAAIATDTQSFGGVASFTGFWGSQSIDIGGIQFATSWGAGWGWYLLIIGGVFLLIAGLASLRAPRPAPMMPAPGYAPGYPGYPMPPQQAPPPPPPYQQP